MRAMPEASSGVSSSLSVAATASVRMADTIRRRDSAQTTVPLLQPGAASWRRGYALKMAIPMVCSAPRALLVRKPVLLDWYGSTRREPGPRFGRPGPGGLGFGVAGDRGQARSEHQHFFGEADASESFGPVRVVNPVRGPGPRRVRRDFLAADAQRLEPPEEHPPLVAVFRRQRPSVREPLHRRPGKCELPRPAFVHHRVVVDDAVDVRGPPQPWHIVIEKRPPKPPRVRASPERFRPPVVVASKGQRSSPQHVPFRRVEPSECVLPDEELLVDGPERVDLELVVAIAAVDEHLDVALLENKRVALGQSGAHERLFDPEANIEILVVPQRCGLS